MASFEMIYDEDEDVLEATFASFDENFARTIPLNDLIVLHTDTGVVTGWGITLYDYSTLLHVSETDLGGLTLLTQPDRDRLFAVIAKPPVSLFLEVLDRIDLRARVLAPSLEAILSA